MALIPAYILILLALILIDYFAGIMIESAQGRKRIAYLWLSLTANLAILCVFKYFNFFMDNLNFLSEWSGMGRPLPYLHFILPIGLSFHTFQAMAYTIEVFKGKQKAERNLWVYALYVMFFPQLVAGPIERPQNLLHQLREYPEFDHQRAVEGARQMLWGLFKKMVIADNLAMIVDRVYNIDHSNPNMAYLTGPAVLLATYCFAFQIYCDFSGYADVALGAAKVLGVQLSENFRVPYIAQSIPEFWHRWHISLSTWFRDYVYIPMGGNRVTKIRHYFNLMFVFLVSGLWHGANMTFIIWGALHGFYSMLSPTAKKYEDRLFTKFSVPEGLRRAVRIFVTFHLVCLGWLFFRAASLHDANFLLSRINLGYRDLFKTGKFVLYESFASGRWKALALSFVILYLVEFRNDRGSNRWMEWLRRQPRVIRWATYYATILVICLLKVDDALQFIYFQF